MKKLILVTIILIMSGCASVNYDADYDPIKHEIYLMNQMEISIN